MHVDNPEALKAWLTEFLEPLCDADPAALAKYVMALVKKDKSESELQTSMTQQMEVFLQKTTAPFVQRLFKAIASKEYLPKEEGGEAVSSAAAAAADVAAAAAAGDDVVKQEGVSEAVPSSGEKALADSTTPVRDSSDLQHQATAQGDASSPDRTSRHVRREPHDRPSRRWPPSRSPPPSQGASYPRRFRRSPGRGGRSRSRSPLPRGRSRSPMGVGGYRRRRSPYNRGRSRTRSRSYSPLPHKRRRSANGESRGTTPVKDEEGAANPYLLDNSKSKASRPPRCRDYDEKGFCMRGDQCKFDHGTDAVVLEDTSGTGVPSYQPGGFPFTPVVEAEPYVPASSVPLPPLHLPPPGYANSYAVPVAPPFPGGNSRKRGYDPAGAGTALDVEAGSGYPPAKLSAFSRLGPGGAAARGRGGRGRGGSRQLAVRNIPPAVNNIAHLNNHFAKFGSLVNIQIQFEGDPASALVTFSNPSEAETAFSSAEAVLGNRFIKMFYHYEQRRRGGAHGSQHHLNPLQSHNKTLKDRLGSKKDDGEKVKFEGDVLTKTIPNKSGQQENEGEGEVAEQEQDDEEAKQKSEEKAAAIAAIQRNQAQLQARARQKKDVLAKRAETLQKAKELQKSKQELLQKLIDEQKLLISKLEEKKKPEEKASLMKLVRSLSESIDRAKEDVKKAVAATAAAAAGGGGGGTTAPAVRKNSAELQKELLDAELELFQAQQDGSDNVPEIQKQVNQLRIEAAKSGVLPTSRPPRGSFRGGYTRGFASGRRGNFYSPRFRGRGRGRGRAGATTVDRRPSKIKVTGFVEEERFDVMAQFQKFGELVEVLAWETDDDPWLIFHYRTRRQAEVAMNGGKAFGEKMLELHWYSDTSAAGGGSTPGLVSAGVVEGGTSSASDLLASSSPGLDPEGSLHEDLDDDYTPLDPAYLPPGLGEDDDDVGKEGDELHDEPTKEEVEQLLGDDDDELEGGDLQEKPEELEEEEEEDEEERSWKR